MAGLALPSRRAPGPHRFKAWEAASILRAGVSVSRLHHGGACALRAGVGISQESGIAARLPASKAFCLARQILEHGADRFEAARETARIEKIVRRRRRRWFRREWLVEEGRTRIVEGP